MPVLNLDCFHEFARISRVPAVPAAAVAGVAAACGGNPLERSSELSYKFRMTLKAIIHKAEEGGFWAEVPALPGCLTQGETLKELKANLREAIELWLSVDDRTTESSVGDEVLELTV